jgi:uncharacterized protein YbbC (DUF1343 family)
VRTGLEVLAAEGFAGLRGKRVGLITNSTGVDRELRPAAELLAQAPGVKLAALFGPEHGLAGSHQAGAEVGDSKDPRTGVVIYSLYGAARRPTPEMLRGIDLLLYDLQDVGARPYTYLSTLRGALEAAAEAGIPLWVLDRPDPSGGLTLDGPVLEPRFESFVGPHPVPLSYGMTPGELAGMLNEERRIGARLQVVRMAGWRRGLRYEETGLPWVAPSPNIPAPATSWVYPGFVLLEGTNLSEGRGTTRPFQLFGAPWLDARKTVEELNRMALPGALFRATEFTPSDSKHRGQRCGAIEVHVTDSRTFLPCAAAVGVLAAVLRVHPGELRFDEPAFDRLAGTDQLRIALLRGDPPERVTASWQSSLEEFRRRRQRYLLYP